jgi:hypothetical protein
MRSSPVRATHHCKYSWRRVQGMRLVNIHFLQPPATSLLFGSNTCTSFNTLSLCSTPNVRDQALHSYTTTGKIRSTVCNSPENNRDLSLMKHAGDD